LIISIPPIVDLLIDPSIESIIESQDDRMSTIKGPNLYDIPEQATESRVTEPLPATSLKAYADQESPTQIVKKETMNTKQKGVVGPCDDFDYEFKTNQFYYKLIVPMVAFIMKFGWKITVKGKRNIPRTGNYVLMPNHISHFDSFIAGAFLAPRPAPIAIGDEKLFRNKYFRAFAERLNAFPVRKGTKNMKIVNYAIKRVNNGDSILWYPEGQRHKTPWENKCNAGKLGSGMLAHSTKAPIIPIYISGAEFAMPVGKRITWGRGPRSIRIIVKYGKPVYLDDLRALPASKETSKLVVDRIIQNIEELRPDTPYQIQKTRNGQTYKQAKHELFKSEKYVGIPEYTK
jgi:1-acyl-sn-glycerol-3-phosphate acyltransferase